MQEAWLGDGTHSNYRRSFADVRPRVYQDGDGVSLQFRIGEIQSEMLASDPNFLVLSYTRTTANYGKPSLQHQFPVTPASASPPSAASPSPSNRCHPRNRPARPLFSSCASEGENLQPAL